ncbi:MAG: hypothetical protein IAI48_03675 [Candidatus Eremiobacteraeota bacterium]|nr:hypothetical protein [Candidatus Eremiobacteraeota bacterium]
MDGGVSFVAPGAVFRRIGRASSVAVSAYVLEPHGAMARALVTAADRGASVSVTLDGLDARATARELRAHGIRVSYGAPSGDDVHLKAAVVDGVAYLNDRNWSANDETIVATSRASEVDAIRDAIAGRPRSVGRLATEKSAALALEADAIRHGGDRIDVESESFGASAISAALRERVAAGAHVRLLVNARVAFERDSFRERALLRDLAARGVEVRVAPAAEKLCVAGKRGWVGSANATYAGEPMTDWGLALDDPAMLATLEDTFERNWSAGRPFATSCAEPR